MLRLLRSAHRTTLPGDETVAAVGDETPDVVIDGGGDDDDGGDDDRGGDDD